MVSEPLNWQEDEYEFVLDITNETNKTRDVTAQDIKVFKKVGEELNEVPSSQFFKANPITNETSLIAVLKPLLPGGKP